jgi:hypothetical protein
MNHIIKVSIFLLTLFSLFACGEESTVEEKEPALTEGEIETQKILKKDYWTATDYLTILYYIDHSKSIKEYPNFDDPDTKATIVKLVDTKNFQRILEDETLSLKDKSDEAQDYFKRCKKMVDLYKGAMTQGKYVYDEELAEILVFSGTLWIAEVKAMNAYIKELSSDWSADEIEHVRINNEKACLRNFRVYLKYVENEDMFGKAALKTYTDGINELFPQALEAFQDANYELTSKVAFRMMAMAKDEDLKEALGNLVDLLEQKTRIYGTN